MDTALKQRLVGAAVLVALAVIFLPMLVQGPAPESGMSDVPLDLPREPGGGFATRDIPLVAPAQAPDSGVVGMDVPETAPVEAAEVATAPLDEAAAPATGPDDAAAPADPAEPAAATAMFPAPAAGGDFAVNFGSFSTVAAADRLVAQLRASQLPGYREAGTVDGRTVQRVRIGPYATRADAEAARLRAAHVRDDVGARVVSLDADDAPAAAKPVATTTPAKPAAPAPAKPAAPAPAAASTGFAVQVGAFSKPGDATALRDRLRAAGFTAFTESVSTDKGALTRVRVGPVLDRAEADRLQQQVRAQFGLDGIVRAHP